MKIHLKIEFLLKVLRDLCKGDSLRVFFKDFDERVLKKFYFLVVGSVGAGDAGGGVSFHQGVLANGVRLV